MRPLHDGAGASYEQPGVATRRGLLPKGRRAHLSFETAIRFLPTASLLMILAATNPAQIESES